MKAFVFLPVLLLSACAGTSNTPNERVLAYQAPQANHAAVQITRPSQFMGAACHVGVMYEETLIARMAAGENITVYLPAGSGLFSVITDPQGNGLCGTQGFSPAMRKVRVEANKVNHIEIGFRGMVFPYIEPK